MFGILNPTILLTFSKDFISYNHRNKFRKVCSEVAWDLWHLYSWMQSLENGVACLIWTISPTLEHVTPIYTFYCQYHPFLDFSYVHNSQGCAAHGMWENALANMGLCACVRERDKKRVDTWFGHTSKVRFQFCKVYIVCMANIKLWTHIKNHFIRTTF